MEVVLNISVGVLLVFLTVLLIKILVSLVGDIIEGYYQRKFEALNKSHYAELENLFKRCKAISRDCKEERKWIDERLESLIYFPEQMKRTMNDELEEHLANYQYLLKIKEGFVNDYENKLLYIEDLYDEWRAEYGRKK